LGEAVGDGLEFFEGGLDVEVSTPIVPTEYGIARLDPTHED